MGQDTKSEPTRYAKKNMKSPWIENYVGTWQDGEGRTLIITIHNDMNAKVDILLHGTPMLRPWCAGKPALGLLAKYSPAEGPDLDINLGRPGFSLNLNYESDIQMTPDNLEYLSVGVSRYEDDEEVELYKKLFGKLQCYKRANA
jgi:hypothetical protein